MVVSTDDASALLECPSAECLRFCAFSQTAQRVGEVALRGERARVVAPERAGLYRERRPQKHRCLRALYDGGGGGGS